MASIHSYTLLEIAEELISFAEQEKERSKEDVVTHLICNNARQSIANFLAGFLIQRNIEIEHPVTLISLLEQCKSIDPRFESLDLTNVNCRHETNDRKYCLESEQVDACMRVAKQTRDLVMRGTRSKE